MTRFHVKKGDEVVIISGADKGKRGKVITIIAKKQRAIVENACMIKKHMRKSQQHPQGEIITREGTVHISNLMKSSEYDARAAKHGEAVPTA